MPNKHISLRDARDKLIDQLTAVHCYPLRDLPVDTKSPIVAYERPVRINVYQSQQGVDYKLFDNYSDAEVLLADDDVNEGVELKEGAGSTQTFLELQTQKGLTKQEYTFRVAAVNQRSGLSSPLYQRVEVKVTVDTTLNFRFASDWIDYGSTAEIIIERTQEYVSYQIENSADEALSDPIVSEGGDLSIVTTKEFQENTNFKIKATNSVDDDAHNISLYLKKTGVIQVLPNLDLPAALKEADWIYNSQLTVAIPNSQSSVTYKLVVVSIDQDCAPYSIAVGAVWSKKVPGIDGTLEIDSKAFREDAILQVIASKKGAPELSLKLTEPMVVKVKPNPGTKVSAVTDKVPKGSVGLIQVSGTQPGVKYQLRNNTNNVTIGWPRFHSKNYGVDKATLGVDLAVGEFSGPTVQLPTAILSKNHTYNVLAIKVSTGLSCELTQTAEVGISS